MKSYNPTRMKGNTDDGNLIRPDHLPPRFASAASALAAIAPIDLATSALCCCSVLGNLAGRYEGLTRSGRRVAPHCNVVLAGSAMEVDSLESALFAPVQACADALAAKAAMIPSDEVMARLKEARFMAPTPGAREAAGEVCDDAPLLQWYAQYAKFLIRFKPVTYLRGTDPDALRASLRESFDRTVLLNGLGSNLLDRLAAPGRTTAPDRRAARMLAAYLRRDTICLDRTDAEAKSARDGGDRFERPATMPGGGAILKIDADQMPSLLKPGGLLADVLANNCILIKPTCREVRTNMANSRDMASWRDLVHEAYYRRCHPGAATQDAANLCHIDFPRYDNDVANACAALPAQLRRCMGQAKNWPYRLAYVLIQCCGPSGQHETAHCVDAAERLARAAVMRHSQVVFNAWSSQRTGRHESAEDVMWRKLARHGGPISFRNLVRLYRDQTSAVHRPVLDALISRGVVRYDNGMYHLVRVEKGLDTDCRA